MTGNQIRDTFLKFYEEKGHKVIPSASLIPENDPTVLFTTAGMHPLVPYLMGEAHPEGKLLADAQKCVRTGDIDEVGDNRHLTFFEMLGNWSLGDYFKKDTIAWSFELLTARFGLDPARLYVSVFEGDAVAPRDDESIAIWQEQYKKAGIDAKVGERIFAYPKAKNWWGPAGLTGPCGPDTEMFYDTLALAEPGQHAPHWSGPDSEKACHPNCDCGRYVEIWNDVFMQYEKTAEGAFVPLAQQNVDTGMGLERMAMMLQNKPTVFETDLFAPLISKIEALSGRAYEPEGSGFVSVGQVISGESEALEQAHAVTVRAMRIVADHVKTATLIMGDQRGVGPSNTDQGYIVRRLIRRAVRFGRQLGIQGVFTPDIAAVVIDMYGAHYSELVKNRERVMTELRAEEEKFSATLERGLKEAQKVLADAPGETIPGDKAFYLYESFGFPKELTEEVLGKKVDSVAWDAAMKAHQDKSRAGAEQKFAGGLADHSEIVVRMHTATHLLHKALRNVLGEHVEQKGSNITAERLRFDFSHPAKMTPEEISKVETLVNEQIQKDLPVRFEMLTVEEAKESGAIGLFEDKYAALGNKVKVYMVGSDEQGYFSKEICGGPHVEHTALVGKFKIAKEEASSAGIRRIKATVQ